MAEASHSGDKIDGEGENRGKMDEKKTVSLCMIVKNEEQFLRQCIESVLPVIDEIIIVDTGSTDRTKEIAREYTRNVYTYVWDGNFSNARNYSIRMASSDWILLLDADEMLEREDCEALLKLIQESQIDGYDFYIKNYVAQNDKENYNTHYALRMIRNDKRYAFRGIVHEQYVPIDEEAPFQKTDGVTIRINHYGYCKEVVENKGKRSRNIPLIERQLKLTPNDPYYLFTLANEYLADENYEKAIELYEASLKNADVAYRYVPYLYQRLIHCYYSCSRYQKAVETAEKALVIYPQCTDYVLLRGIVYYSWHKVLLAADDFRKCIEMGPSPIFFNFIADCSTTKPRIFLATIYQEAGDYATALQYYTEVIKSDAKSISYLYPIMNCLMHIFHDSEQAIQSITLYFSTFFSNYRMEYLIDILISGKCYGAAEKIMEQYPTIDQTAVDYEYCKAKISFYTKKYKEAATRFTALLKGDLATSILPDVRRFCYQYLFLLSFVEQSVDKEIVDAAILQSGEEHLKEICIDIRDIVENGNTIVEGYESHVSSQEKKISMVMELLESLLAIQEFDLFEKFLSELNRVDDKNVLLKLGGLYQKYGYYTMASNVIMRSIKEMDTFDYSSLCILADNSTLRL
ncbi:MAG: glycosyltransferase [Lachnospiraceae bacterium]|nr:glycosyltransferase [Lachnospiraceae bacterium]